MILTARVKLEGKRVSRLEISVDQRYLRMSFTDGTSYALEAVGDCCSQTWFADVIGYEALLGGDILSVDEIDMPQPTDVRGRSDVDTNYGIKITTTAGYCDLVYRNASNGYYGGWCNELDPATPIPEAMETVTQDWSS